MNDKKICFILCAVDSWEAEETAVYINNLQIPTGFEVETILLKNVGNKAEAYNKAMKQSDAKYKVYLREDVRIINPFFLSKVLRILKANPTIGMLGVVGRQNPRAVRSSKVSYKDGISYGKLFVDYVDKRMAYNYAEIENDYVDVLLLEDYLLVTQQDVTWREDLFQETQFCEYSQAIEFWKAGYEVVVPKMEYPWCFVDNEEDRVVSSKWESVFRREYLSFCDNWEGYFSNNIKQAKAVGKKGPLVSVLTSVYNAENFLEETLRSIMNQTYKNLQIIVVDDCSSDNSRKIIDRLAEEDSRIIKVYMPRNSHMCKASNAGYQYATGKYVAIIGHDDIWNSDKIEKQVMFMEANPDYAAAFTLVDIIDDNGRISNAVCKNIYELFDQHNRIQEEWMDLLYSGINVLCAPSAMVRKECLKDKPLYQFGLVQLQDYALWFDLLKEYPIYIIRERLMKYRQFIESKSNLSFGSEKIAQRLSNERNYIFKNVIMKMTEEQFVRFFQKYFRCKDSQTKEELLCEKAFILLAKRNYYCIGMFMELFEEEATRNLLEEKYRFYLTEFYEINRQAFY